MSSNLNLKHSTEINRLENSLKKLRETQEFLQSYLEATPDAEIAQVLEENKVVM
jgi:DNA-directed RNA polymerase specialized sigma24 family protein